MRFTSKTITLIVISALAILLLGLGLGWWLQNSSTTQSNNSISASPTPSSSSVPTIKPTPTLPAVPACATSQLSLYLADDAGGGAAGSAYSSIVLSNTSKTTCSVAGYPGVSLVHDQSVQVGSPAERSSTVPVTTITLLPGGSASSTMQVVQNNFDAGVCKDGATQLRVYPPDQTEPLVISTSVTTWCPGFSVTALFTK